MSRKVWIVLCLFCCGVLYSANCSGCKKFDKALLYDMCNAVNQGQGYLLVLGFESTGWHPGINDKKEMPDDDAEAERFVQEPRRTVFSVEAVYGRQRVEAVEKVAFLEPPKMQSLGMPSKKDALGSSLSNFNILRHEARIEKPLACYIYYLPVELAKVDKAGKIAVHQGDLSYENILGWTIDATQLKAVNEALAKTEAEFGLPLPAGDQKLPYLVLELVVPFGDHYVENKDWSDLKASVHKYFNRR